MSRSEYRVQGARMWTKLHCMYIHMCIWFTILYVNGSIDASSPEDDVGLQWRTGGSPDQAAIPHIVKPVEVLTCENSQLAVFSDNCK